METHSRILPSEIGDYSIFGSDLRHSLAQAIPIRMDSVGCYDDVNTSIFLNAAFNKSFGGWERNQFLERDRIHDAVSSTTWDVT